MLKKTIITLFFVCVFAAPFYGTDKEGVIVLDSPEEIKQFMQMIQSSSGVATKEAAQKAVKEHTITIESPEEAEIFRQNLEENAVLINEKPMQMDNDDFDAQYQKYINKYSEGENPEVSGANSKPVETPTYKYDKSKAGKQRAITK